MPESARNAPVRRRPKRLATLGVLRRYRGVLVRIHTAIRFATCPWGPVIVAVPHGGEVLDFGCGHGVGSLLLAHDDPTRLVLGVDCSARKIDAAKVAARAGESRVVSPDATSPDATGPDVTGPDAIEPQGTVTFRLVDEHWRPESSAKFDTVLIVDVLYLLAPDVAVTTVCDLAAAVRPGGRMVIKEVAPNAGWKSTLSHAQEHIATRILRYTDGATNQQIDLHELASRLDELGFSTTVTRIDRHYPHPHELLIADRPPTDFTTPTPAATSARSIP